MNTGCKDDGSDGKDSNDADIIILEDLTHSAERLHLSSPKKKLNDAREKAAYFEKESNKAEVQQITRSLSEAFVHKAMYSALNNMPDIPIQKHK